MWRCNKGILKDINIKLNTPIKLCEDNTGAIALAKNDKFFKNSKHIDVNYHYVDDYYKKELIDIIKVDTEYQLADISN